MNNHDNYQSLLMTDEFIGRGTFGEVYTNRQIVAKRIFATDIQLVKREIEGLRKIHSQYIIKYTEVEIHNNYIVIISDYAKKGSLASVLKNNDVLITWNMRRVLVAEIIKGLEFLHSHGIIHGNLKSSNILFDHNCELKICDFGLKTIKAHSSTTSSNVRWMAPELFSLRPQYGIQSDIYSFGMVMWEIASRKTLPFENVLDNFIVMACVQRGERETVPDNTPSDYVETIKRCWYQEPGKRHILKDDPDILLEIEDLNIREHDDYELAVDCLSRRDYDQAFELFYVCAKNGNINAQYQLAQIYHHVKRNYIKAYKWYRQLAGQNHADSQLGLGLLYEDWQNPTKAFKWYMRSAKQNNPKAQCQVARMYKYGHGIKINYREAFKWYTKAAEQHYHSAYYGIGYFYERGCAVKKDYAEALKWYKKSVQVN